MTMAIVLLGLGVGAGIAIVLRALHPHPPAISAVLTTLDQPGRSIDEVEPSGASERRSTRALQLVESLGIQPGKWTQDILLVERTPARHAADKVLAGTSGFLMPNLLGFVLGTIGAGVPAPVTVLLSLGLAAGGFVLPDRLLRDQAAARRRGFRFALSSYLDLVNILLAGGAGIETALHEAANIGDGWGYRLIRSELRRARLIARPPWETLASLGERIGVSELSELAANVSLAGSQGARIRASLATKADTLRGHQIAETETAAEAATERMTVPVAVLLLGFLLLIAYPAVAQITSVGGPQP